jgi:predicted negative regulator of RcsB-dependent stress response
MIVVLVAWLVIIAVGLLGWSAWRRDQRRHPRA